MKRLLFLVFLLPTACRCNPGGDPPTLGEEDAVLLAGIPLKTRVFYQDILNNPETAATRSRAPRNLPPLSDSEAALVGYSRERHIHLFANDEEEILASFDVAFLDQDRKIREIKRIDENRVEGAVSLVPAKYALLLRRGWLLERGVRLGTTVEFSSTLSNRTPPSLPEITIGDEKVRVEIAQNHEDRVRGLKFRTALSEDEGMLFIYGDEPEAIRRFWMEETLIPLDIAFIRKDGTIINVVETKMWDDPKIDPGTRSESNEKCPYVLEVNFQWFRRHGFLDAEGKVRSGLTATIPEAFRTVEREDQ